MTSEHPLSSNVRLLSCPFCKREAKEDGSIYHDGACEGIESVILSKLQLWRMQAEMDRLRAVLHRIADYSSLMDAPLSGVRQDERENNDG